MKTIKRTFDRIARFDERSRAYNVRSVIRGNAQPINRSWPCYTVLDQGSEGACTGFGTACEAACEPVVVPGIDNAVARAVYLRAKQLDTIAGEDYEGSTVLGAVQAAVERGWYSEYRWAFSVDDLILAICHTGPAILGVNWYEGMAQPDSTGFIYARGKLTGGHCVCAVGYNVRLDAVRLQNSWGKKWGMAGRCWIGRKDLKKLAANNGEACIPIIRGKGGEG
jgi:hypothetical protein